MERDYGLGSWLQRKFCPPVGVRIEALSAPGREPYSYSGVTCDSKIQALEAFLL